MQVIHLYKEPGLSDGKLQILKNSLRSKNFNLDLKTEHCYNVEVSSTLSKEEIGILQWILGPAHNIELVLHHSNFDENGCTIIEIGPRLNFSTAFSSNAVSICHSVGLSKVTRMELSTRYLLLNASQLSKEELQQITDILHDRMTQCQYLKPISSFDLGIEPKDWFEVDILGKGKKALEEVNTQLGLAFDDWDLEYYTNLFLNKLKRNPTSVECFDLAQSNSEHSRHWFFKGKMVVNSVEEELSLIDMIINTQNYSNDNNVIKFSDNSSAIKGFTVLKFRAQAASKPSRFHLVNGKYHLIFTAETHNFPTGVAPFSGATTGVGGRLRDVQCVGRGGYYIAGTAGYSVGNLLIPGYDLPWEDKSAIYPSNFASPLEILIEASNGASDYGNKFGEPLICGFTRTFGLDLNKDRREWIKPIMFSGGIGVMDDNMTEKMKPEAGMYVVKVGGPIYRIGVGGGAASSIEIQGDNKAELDFGAVQRGDAEMEQKLNRLLRGCLELGEKNPILSIHDQGAGGNGNVLKELVEPEGAVVFAKCFTLGDPSINALELWGAEYQESNAFLCHNSNRQLLTNIAARERCPINFVGTVTSNGKIILTEEKIMNTQKYLDGSYESENMRYPVNLDLELVLGKMPRKEFVLDPIQSTLKPLDLPKNLTTLEALNRVLRLPSVASKRYLTNKVDRCVTGLIAQQQCVGPLHTPLADVAVTAISYFNTEGIASAIGEQPIKGLICPAAGARMSVAESLTNLVFAAITDIKDIKCSGNWMWAAKLPGEGAALYNACVAMCELMKQLGIAVDGGKDSLSMAARVGDNTVKAPGTLVISSYAPCPDIHHVITPDLKQVGSHLLYIDLSCGKSRLGGTALAQCFQQLGDNVADVENPELLKSAFNATQKLISKCKLLSGHDVSDGGLITCLLEMCFGGIVSIDVDIKHKKSTDAISVLFSEELGWVLEVSDDNLGYVMETFRNASVPCHNIGRTIEKGFQTKVSVKVNGVTALENQLHDLFKMWEETSYQLELRQANPECVTSEMNLVTQRKGPQCVLTFDPQELPIQRIHLQRPPAVGVIREEGSNGDREMSASLFQAGFRVYDVTMQDLIDRKITIDEFRGIVFPGGFSYADVLGSAKGWAASILFNEILKDQFKAFAARKDTFSLGVCNGCQLLALLGWINTKSIEDSDPLPDVVLDHNKSERFECRFSNVRFEKSNSVLLKDMEDSVFGVWVAHGEGRFTFKNEQIYEQLKSNKQIALQYVDDNNIPTETYPLNPNGSPFGIAGICSKDGRHLAMMPHPERTTQLWQWPMMPEELKGKTRSPWMRMFHNAYIWSNEIGGE